MGRSGGGGGSGGGEGLMETQNFLFRFPYDGIARKTLFFDRGKNLHGAQEKIKITKSRR